MITVLVLGCIAVGILFYSLAANRQARRNGSLDSEAIDAAFEKALEGADQLTQVLIRSARPLAHMPQVYDQKQHSVGRWTQEMLLASGGAYGNSTDVFLAVQVLFVIIGGVMAALGLTGSIPAWLGVFSGLMLAAYPVSKLMSNATARKTQLMRQLPEFAELLQMPLSSGNGVLTSLEFCANRLEGIVADEVYNMLTLIRTRSMTEAEAFVMAGERLGTPEAKAFFGALLQAHLEGAKVVETINSQAEALRKQAFEARRAIAKKLPVKIVVIFAVHMITSMIAMALIPAMIALTTTNI